MTTKVGRLTARLTTTIARRSRRPGCASCRDVPPEFLNRIDETIFFEPLAGTQRAKIVRIQLARFEKLLAERQLVLRLSDQAISRVAEAGYDPIYGARPLKRALQKLVIDPLATHLLAGDFHAGDVIEADVEGDRVTFHKVASGAAA